MYVEHICPTYTKILRSQKRLLFVIPAHAGIQADENG